MPHPFNIQYLSHHEIDKTKWDQCISEAENGLIYGYSFILITWQLIGMGLVLNDYEAVMPLTWNKKYGILLFVSALSFARSWAVFGKNIDTESIKAFLKSHSVQVQILGYLSRIIRIFFT
jgi:hypothetical protein